MVGAPRAQSSLGMQRKINETGAIYKCSFNSLNCELFVIDKQGNITSEHNGYELNSELKSNQWLGASIDGSSSEDSLFVVRLSTFAEMINANIAFYSCVIP